MKKTLAVWTLLVAICLLTGLAFLITLKWNSLCCSILAAHAAIFAVGTGVIVQLEVRQRKELCEMKLEQCFYCVCMIGLSLFLCAAAVRGLIKTWGHFHAGVPPTEVLVEFYRLSLSSFVGLLLSIFVWTDKKGTRTRQP